MSNENESSSTDRQPLRLLVRTKEAVELYTVPDTSSATEAVPAKKGGAILHGGKTTFHVLSPDGQAAFVHDASVGLLRCDLRAVDASNVGAQTFLNEDSKAVQLAKCSPRGSCLVTWERHSGANNLKVWDARNGTLLTSFSCKKATLAGLQWTHDEKLAFHLVTNEIHIYDADTWKRVGKVRCQGVSSFSLPSVKGVASNIFVGNDAEEKYLLTVFTPGTKGKPSRIDLLRYPDRLGRESSTVSAASSASSTSGNNGDAVNLPSGPSLTSKSLFHAEEAHVQWSPRADAALVLTQTSIDSTGESYYGSSHLFLLLENDAKRPGNGSAISVPLPPEATKDAQGTVPIVSCSWVPNPTITGIVPFTVISGRMPALASLHHGITGEPTFLFGRAHRNSLDISPHGRFLVVGGYGNLAGGMDFWDRNKGKMIPRHVVLPGKGGGGGDDDNKCYVTIKEAADLTVTSSSPVVGHEWSPDSRTYVVSTTSPRMNVENGIHLYRYDGALVEESRLPWDNSKYLPDKLLSVQFVPAPCRPTENNTAHVGKSEFYHYPDRPQSPVPRRYKELKGEEAKAALAKLRASQVGNGKGNSNRGMGGAGAMTSATAYVPPAARKAGGGSYVPPGARRGAGGGGTSLAERMRQEREGGIAAVSAKKVTKKVGPVGAASVVAAADASSNNNPDGKSKNAIRREKQRVAKEMAEREAAEAERRKKEEETARAQANMTDPEKRAKKIKKTLKQIDDIKEKERSGEELNDDQRKKLSSEASLREELASMGL
ncbi:hypothetical protein ACHAXS_004022 [Conticribra weissflogii]